MTVSGAIIDLDGTVYRGGSLLPGAPAGIDTLREAGLELLFFSNNPILDERGYVEYLGEFGLDVRPGEACSAGAVTREYLVGNHADDEVLLIGDEGLREQLVASPVTLTDDPDRADVLLASWTASFDFEDMKTALHALNGDTTFLGTDPDRTFPREDGDVVPGSGAIIGSIAATADREPDAILGKPSDVALEMAVDRLGVSPTETLIVGDRLDTDLLMGDRAGMTTALVLSGVSDRSDVPPAEVSPDYVIDGLGNVEDVLNHL